MKLPSVKILLVILVLATLFLPELAFAQDFPFKPSPGDKSREWFIKGLFGKLDGGGSDPLAEIIRVFNSAVLLVGGILLFYTLIAGVMQTAHDGEMLGKRWSSLWLPVRTALGVAAIIPGVSGYCLIQFAVIWLAVQGIGIADVMTNKFLDKAVTGQYSFTVSAIKPEITATVRSMTMNSACAHAFQSDINANADDTKAVLGYTSSPALAGKVAGGLDALGTYLSSDSGIDTFWLYNYGCGTVAMPGKQMDSSVTSRLQLIDLKKLADLRKAMWTVNDKQKNIALVAASNLGAQIILAARANEPEAATKAKIDKGVDAIAEAWSQATVKAAAAQSESMVNEKLKDAMRNDGWILLGSWYMQITLAQQAITESTTILPEVSNPDALITRAAAASDRSTFGNLAAAAGNALGSSIVPGYMVLNNLTNEKFYISQDAGSSIVYAARITNGGGADNAVETAGAMSPKGMFSSVTRKITSAFSNVDFGMNGSKKNPVIMATEIGGRLTLSVSLTVAVMAVIAGVAGLGATVGTNIVIVLVSIISPLLIALLGAGLTLSYYIPMLPYILWLGAVFGWVVLVVEAVIASPIWAVSHLAPDADGVVGKGGQGYMLVLSLTLRPGLMVFGFAAAVAVMNPMGTFVNETFMGTFFSSVSPGFIGVVKILAGSVLYAVIMMMIINRVFSLIHQIPDGILRWIGGGDNVIGREANAAEHGSGKAIVASTALAGAVGGLSNAGQQAGAAARQNRMEKTQRDQGNAATAAQTSGNLADNADRTMTSATKSANNLDGKAGTSGFEAQEQHSKQQSDAAATAAVSSIKANAHSTLANYNAKKPGDVSRPSDSDASAASAILSSIGSGNGGKGADTTPSAARDWLKSNSSNSSPFAESKFGSQIANAAGRQGEVDQSLQDSRKNHMATMARNAEIAGDAGGDGEGDDRPISPLDAPQSE